jgi:hypothetical protein
MKMVFILTSIKSGKATLEKKLEWVRCDDGENTAENTAANSR